jgi:hypothetical protein
MVAIPLYICSKMGGPEIFGLHHLGNHLFEGLHHLSLIVASMTDCGDIVPTVVAKLLVIM